jgi:hypothetical protein
MCKASATAIKRLAREKRLVGTDLPGFPGILHTWGRQLQYHPPIHYIGPGGGLAKDRTIWLPSRDNCFVPVKALSPIYRAVFKEPMAKAGLLERIAPQVWQTAWNVHSQANPNGHPSFKYRAPYVCKVAISKRRIVSLTDRPVTFTYRKPGSARPRTTRLDAIAFIRRFLPHVLPEGFMKVRHFGFMQAGCAIKIDTIRTMILTPHPVAFKVPNVVDPEPWIASCPTCGAPMRLIMRLWVADRALLDTG